MKRVNAILLMIMVIVGLGSCIQDIDNEPLTPEEFWGNTIFGAGWSSYSFTIAIGFIDNTGKDLTTPLADERWIYPASDADRYEYSWSGGINPVKYDLDLTLSHPDVLPHDISGVVYYNNRYPVYELTMSKYTSDYELVDYSDEDGRYYLCNLFGYPRTEGLDILLASGIDDYIKENPQQEYIIYKLSCPTIFGDNKVHELVTYWEDDLCFPSNNPESEKQWTLYPNCTRVIFDGKEIPVKTVVTKSYDWRDFYEHFIDIVVDR